MASSAPSFEKDELFDALNDLASSLTNNPSHVLIRKSSLVMRFLATFKRMTVPPTFPTADATFSLSQVATIALAVDALHVYSEVFRVADASGPGILPSHGIILPLAVVQAAEGCWPIAWQWIAYILAIENRSSVLRVPINMNMAQTRQSLSRVLRPDDVLIHYSISSKLHLGHILYSAVANLPWSFFSSVVTTAPGIVEMLTRLYAPYAERTDITTLMRMWHTAPSDHTAKESRRLLRFLRSSSHTRKFLLRVGLSLQFLHVIIGKTVPSDLFIEQEPIMSEYIYILPICEEALKLAAHSNSLIVDQEGVDSVLDRCCPFLLKYPYSYSWLKNALRRGLFYNMVRCWLAAPEEEEPRFLEFMSTRLAPALLYLPVLRSFVAANKAYNLDSIYSSSECIRRKKRFPAWNCFLLFSESCTSTLQISMDFWTHCDFCNRETARHKQKRCGGCQMACYCSRQCQKDAWQIHRAACLEWRSDIAGTGDFQPSFDKYSPKECFIFSHHLSHTNRTFIRDFILSVCLTLHERFVRHSDLSLEDWRGEVFSLRFDLTKVEDFVELAKAQDGMLRSPVEESYSGQWGIDILVVLPVGGPFNLHTVIVSHKDFLLSPPDTESIPPEQTHDTGEN
ncbi:hypothetical protein BDZ89DRAFT_594315 [Hymenopellis radicata]|nr:hypothetical protein BDZ89DRAFT_594315 [Hymenopellis radicata]